MTVQLVHVVHRGGGAAILDLVAGHVKVGSMTFATDDCRSSDNRNHKR
jgi:tripartite-type tricarboxylate transporter receptor subunit TctC